ncbi:hypothetical protein HDU77_009105, partial [Chytriomyces hyalinus]
MVEVQFLSQLDESGREYISHCFSGLWNHYELQYHIVKKELISVAKGLKCSVLYLSNASEICMKSDAGTMIQGMINNPAIHDKVAQWTIAYILQFSIMNDSRELDDKIDRVFDLKITCLTAAIVAHTP